MVERFIQPGTFGFKNALSDPEPGFSQQRKTLARVPRIWVDCANDDFMDSRGNDFIGAWGGSAPGATRRKASSMYSLMFKQSAGKCSRIEWLQIVGLFAKPDEFHGQT